MAYVFGLPQDVTELIYSMRVWMPRRPRHGHVNNSFMMDFENDLLDGWEHDIPQGPRRFENAAWAQLVQRNVYPAQSDVDWDEYVRWVQSGGGDEWFLECVQPATDIVA